MIEPDPYYDESRRLESLNATGLLDTPIEERFERITRMVCRVLDVPIAIFNLIDVDRQHYKSVRGLAAVNAALPGAFCTHAVNSDSVLLVTDAKKDDRFHDNPFVTGEYLDIGFYAGCPVHTPDGMPIGTLCAIDTKPRDMTPDQMAVLRDLAHIVETELRAASLSKAQQELLAQLEGANRLALIDSLTRLWNRAGIFQLLDKEWKEAARQKKPVTVVMGDIDHFKKINDRYGHAAGDEALRGVAGKLLETLRGEDAVGRVGGEEFLIILTDCLPDRMADTVNRIRRAIEGHAWVLDGHPHTITMSFGVASAVPGDRMSLEALVRAADKALYRAKNGGRNRVEVADI